MKSANRFPINVFLRRTFFTEDSRNGEEICWQSDPVTALPAYAVRSVSETAPVFFANKETHRAVAGKPMQPDSEKHRTNGDEET